MIDPTAYRPLLDTIAKGESNGNYNAYFGHAGKPQMRFTDMTVAEVMDWQQKYVEQGAASNAVGRYQFMGTTLAGLVKQLHISKQAKFDEALQDRLAIALIERRGSLAYVQQKITREEFAANLAMEWAALPRVIGGNPHQSYYAGDGLNHARVSSDEVFKAIDKLTDS
jgi:conjugal transfer mating pair stabilization protein TraG